MLTHTLVLRRTITISVAFSHLFIVATAALLAVSTLKSP